jgi:tRNA-dihydrouridine synthase B
MLAIGEVRVAMPAVQAALSGYSDRPMRLVARRYGAEYALNEVVLDELVLTNGKLRKRLLSVGADDHPVGGQLMGSEPGRFAEAAAELVEGGYDVVDINFGCPVKKVLGRCRGGWLLSEPRQALAIVRAVMDAVGGRRPVTLKMRRGYDDEPASERAFFEILDGAFALGAAAITVHGRTVKQRYVGPSNWAFLARVKKHAGGRTILGSGDLFTASAVKRMLDETGVDGASVARGAIGNPFIFRECREILAGRPLPAPPTIAEQREAFEAHFALALEEYGDERGGRVMRMFGIRYSELHPLRADVRRAFIETNDTSGVRAVVERWYDPSREWPPCVRRETPADLIAAGATA